MDFGGGWLVLGGIQLCHPPSPPFGVRHAGIGPQIYSFGASAVGPGEYLPSRTQPHRGSPKAEVSAAGGKGTAGPLCLTPCLASRQPSTGKVSRAPYPGQSRWAPESHKNLFQTPNHHCTHTTVQSRPGPPCCWPANPELCVMAPLDLLLAHFGVVISQPLRGINSGWMLSRALCCRVRVGMRRWLMPPRTQNERRPRAQSPWGSRAVMMLNPPHPALSPGITYRSAGLGLHRHLGLLWHPRPGMFNGQSVRHSQPRLLWTKSTRR